MITGHDIIYWFSDLWYDLMNLGTADIPSLVGRLALLFFGFVLARGVLSFVWRVIIYETLQGPLSALVVGLVKLITWPVRAPYRLRQRRKEAAETRARQARYEAQRAQEAQAQAERQEQERRKQIAETVRLQKAMRID